MEELIILYRFAQLYTHNAHNLVSKVVFFSDHEFLGNLYETYTSDYDDLVERVIGLEIPIDLNAVQMAAVQHLQSYDASKMKENGDCFKTILMIEKTLCQHIETLIKTGGLSQGTINLLADKCDKSESRQYKLSRRTK